MAGASPGCYEPNEPPEHIAKAWIAKPFQAIHVFLTSLRATLEGSLRLLRDR